jgi:hypothetical protein
MIELRKVPAFFQSQPVKSIWDCESSWSGLSPLFSIWCVFRPERVRSGQISKANPRDDIKDTRRIADVYVDGTKVDRAALARQFKG